jgi:hypothetical protein
MGFVLSIGEEERYFVFVTPLAPLSLVPVIIRGQTIVSTDDAMRRVSSLFVSWASCYCAVPDELASSQIL